MKVRNLLSVFVAFCALAVAQVTPTIVQDSLVDVSGRAFEGTVIIEWPNYISGSSQVVGGRAVVPVRNGRFRQSFAPTPIGVYLTVAYAAGPTSPAAQHWSIPASATPVSIADILVSVPVPQDLVVQLTQIARGGAENGQALIFNESSGQWEPGALAAGGCDACLQITNNLSDVADPAAARTNLGAQAALGYTPENSANKSTNPSLGTSDTAYPSQKAVKDYVDAGLSAKQNSLGFTPENSANRGAANGYAPLDSSSLLPQGNVPGAIPATKIGGGAVDDAEFARLNGLTGDIQAQLDGKLAAAAAAGGDLGGNYPNPSVVKVNGGSVPISKRMVGTDSNGRIVDASATFIYPCPVTGTSAALSCSTGFSMTPQDGDMFLLQGVSNIGCDVGGTNLSIDGSTPVDLVLVSGDFVGDVCYSTPTLLITYWNAANRAIVFANTASGTIVCGVTGGIPYYLGFGTSYICSGNSPRYVSDRFIVPLYGTNNNCSSSASPATCGTAPSGAVVVAAGSTTVQVNTSAINANSQVFVQFDSSLGSKLSVTCNTDPATVGVVRVSSRAHAFPNFNFVISVSGSVATNPACFSYFIVN